MQGKDAVHGVRAAPYLPRLLRADLSTWLNHRRHHIRCHDLMGTSINREGIGTL
jgi:hypothetical protein